ncbi:WxL domain-containing protein [Carnobacterium divergens]|uniref:WxL domain-containing protein n=1 Tax=Carnobacterium divergens TaxID=2748 RepID=A0AAW8RBU6_CARDV|nr:pectate lyase-like adhesive domain-containing protein [Carnobacterium divergens]MDT1958935.1 WxL domain-containing protein [Carnobacterium divergens]MDT1974903.1 WxL domain-containing protein [Carnobacterium divergens]
MKKKIVVSILILGMSSALFIISNYFKSNIQATDLIENEIKLQLIPNSDQKTDEIRVELEYSEGITEAILIDLPEGIEFQEIENGQATLSNDKKVLTIDPVETKKSILTFRGEPGEYSLVAYTKAKADAKISSLPLVLEMGKVKENELEETEVLIEKKDQQDQQDQPSEEIVEVTDIIEGDAVAEQEVSTWDQFVQALGNASISKIILKNNLIATSNAQVNRKVEVEGNNFLINSVSYSIKAQESADLAVKDIKFTGTSSSALFSGNGKVTVKGNFNSLSNNLTGMASMSGGSFTMDGVDANYDRGSNQNPAIEAKYLTITNGSKFVSESERFYRITNKADNGATVVIDKGSKVRTSSMKGTTSTGDRGQAWQMEQKVDMFVRDAGTELYVEGNGKQRASNGGIFMIFADNSTLNVLDGADMQVHSQYASAVMLQSSGGQFNVKNNSTLKLSQKEDNGYNLGSTLRFRVEGDMTFNVEENSKIEILKDSGYAPSIRMYGGGNKVNVRSGSDFIVKNKGEGNPQDPGGNANNQALQYTSGGNNEFNLTGENSSVDIQANLGAAIDAENNSIDINAGNQTYFVARGTTAKEKGAIFNGGAMNFVMTNPKYFDFRNDREGGGYLFSNSAKSKLQIINSDISVWDKGTYLDGNPSKTWTLINATLSQANFNKVDSSSSADFLSRFGSATNYSRMSANNQSAIVDELRMPTDADKFIFGHVSVPEGKNDENRDAWTDEVGVRVTLYNSDGTKSQEFSSRTIGKDSSGGGLSVYGEPSRGGMFKIPVKNNEFLKVGQKIEVNAAWRGTDGEGSNNVHLSSPEDIQVTDKTVVDVTPPLPTELATSTTIDNATKQIKGMNSEPGSIVTIEINGKPIEKSVVVGATGEWTYDLPYYLDKSDVVQVFLRDQAGKAIEVKNPPVTNDEIGNVNPKKDMSYHDAIFKAAPQFVVNDVLADENSIIKSVSVDNENNATQVGSVLSYTLNISNNKKTAATWGNVWVEDSLAQELKLDKESVKVNGSTVSDDKVIYDPVTNIVKIYVGNLVEKENAVVTFDTKVTSSAIGKVIENKALAQGELAREIDPFEPGALIPEKEKQKNQVESNIVTNPGGPIFGMLEFVSAPKTISFGDNLKISSNTKEYPVELLDDNLVVQDSRAIKESWTLTAKMTQELTSPTKKTLPNSLQYIRDGQKNVMSSDSLIIEEQTSNDDDEVVVSEKWDSKSNGFILSVKPGEAYPEAYQGTIEWTLQDTPSND